jgi:hypothetical protein
VFDPISLAIYVGLALVNTTLAARAARKKISDVEFPTDDANRKIPYIAGTVELSPHVIDWSDFKRSSVRTEFPAWINWLFPITAIIDQLPFGYRYYIGMALGLCHGPGVIIKAIKAADHIVWTGSQSGGSLTVAKPGEFGADGGLYAVCDHAPGSMTQLRNSYWNTIRSNVPAFRGTSVLYWRGPSSGAPALGKIKYSGYIGRTTQVKEFKIRLARFPNNLGTGFEIVNTNHANFAEVIYELLTDQIVGLGIPTSLIDSASFAAAAITLHTEALGCSFKWEQPTELVDIITRLLETIDAALYTSIDTGEITLKLIRPDYVLGDLIAIDETQTGVELELERSDPNNYVGEVRIPFTDVEKNFAQGEALAQSISARLQQSYATSATLERLGIGDAPTANQIATRDWRALVGNPQRGTLRTNRETYNFTVGQAFKLSWAPIELEETVFRVLEIDYGTIYDGKISIKIVEDQFSIGESELGVTTATSWTDPIVITPSDGAIVEVISKTTTAPPATPTIGDAYIVPAGATGAWSGHTDELAFWDGTQWIFTPADDDLTHRVIYNLADNLYYRWTGSAWEIVDTSFGIAGMNYDDIVADPTSMSVVIDPSTMTVTRG